MTPSPSAFASPTVRSAAPTFSGHQTFVFRYPWLKKGVDALEKDPKIFRADDAIVRLGVGKNMVDSIRYWGLCTGVIEEAETAAEGRIKPLQVSEFGRRLLSDNGWDAYLEDDASLWLLHHRLVTNPTRATTWYFAFNLYPNAEFTKEGLRDALKRYAETHGGKARISDVSLDADVSCFVRTYLPGRRGLASTPEETFDCPLASLGLLVPIVPKKSDNGKKQATLYRFSSKQRPGLPPSVFAYALADFWNKHHARQETVSLREIVHGEGAPGRVFRLDEDATLGYLDGLAHVTNNALFFADTALVRQVVRREPVDPLTLLETYYDAHAA